MHAAPRRAVIDELMLKSLAHHKRDIIGMMKNVIVELSVAHLPHLGIGGCLYTGLVKWAMLVFLWLSQALFMLFREG